MNSKELITNRYKTIKIECDNVKVATHFENPNSFSTVILNQINAERIYDNIFEEIKAGSTIIDAGANVGLFSLYAQDGNNTVFSIEPTPDHFEILENITKNYDNINAFNFAFSPEDGEVEFYICDTNSTMNSITNKYGKSIKVKGIRLDTFLKDNKIKKVDFIKIDTEGSEMLFLTEEIINNVKTKIKKWFIEAHQTSSNSLSENVEILKKRFENCGIILEKHGHDTLISKN